VFQIAAHAQRRIVEYLDGVQAQVAELKRLQAESAAELERLSGAVLKHAFEGQLVPQDRTASRRQPCWRASAPHGKRR
jgi:hypothetical protein